MAVKVGDFGEALAPNQILAELLADASEFDLVICVAARKDGLVQSCWSDGGSLKRLGMLEVAKSEILGTMSIDDNDNVA